MSAARFTVTSDFSGRIFAVAVGLDEAERHVLPYGADRDALTSLRIGESWKSDPYARGLKVTRIS